MSVSEPSIIEKVKQFSFQANVKGVGQVVRVGDGVITVSGLAEAFLGEVVENSQGFKGLVLNLTKEKAEVIVLNGFDLLRGGLEVYTSGKTLKVPAGESLMGRVVNALGEPVDGQGEIIETTNMPVERKALGIVHRQPVQRPLQTGIKPIDAMIPIGRGQRELIIGDRGTGKTAIGIDAIINQKNNSEDTKVHCFYVAIGQKESKVAQIVARLKQMGAMDYTTVVVAGAGSPVSWQYLSPYTATAMAEYFLDRGQDALVVYDDLTKHAWAYREISLVLKRPPGREAYPGDIFYLHAKLLERAGQLNKLLGGGSLTALPIIETQAGDVSAYIPTNVISITDGQIYLEKELFHAGFRPAINAGLSVSRVGGNAQIKPMKQLTGKLRLELAQYRELSAFSQFAADLDAETQKKLKHGEKIMAVMKQDQYQTLAVEDQLVIFWAAGQGYLDEIPLPKVRDFEADLLSFVKTSRAALLNEIRETRGFSEELNRKMKELLIEFKKGHDY